MLELKSCVQRWKGKKTYDNKTGEHTEGQCFIQVSCMPVYFPLEAKCDLCSGMKIAKNGQDQLLHHRID